MSSFSLYGGKKSRKLKVFPCMEGKSREDLGFFGMREGNWNIKSA